MRIYALIQTHIITRDSLVCNMFIWICFCGFRPGGLCSISGTLWHMAADVLNDELSIYLMSGQRLEEPDTRYRLSNEGIVPF
jgi:hypothetical protein